MHRIAAPAGTPPWDQRTLAKHRRTVAEYRTCGVRLRDGGAILELSARDAGLLAGRPSGLQHGDFHVGNLIVRHGEYAGPSIFSAGAGATRSTTC